MYNVGVIGAGNMGGAILRGVIDAGYLKPGEIYVYDHGEKRMQELANELPELNYCANAAEAAEISEVLIFAVKPNVLKDLLIDLLPDLKGKTVVSIAAGWTTSMLNQVLDGSGASVLRVMPNTPALVAEGMTAICAEHSLSDEMFQFVKGIFDSIGRTVVLPEKQFDGAVAISGSSPAYVYMMIEAMADAGVREGLRRSVAYEMAAQSLLGSALMVLSSNQHPGSLKDAVCSPGGTTIDAVAELEKHGFRAAIIHAMEACANKSREMSKRL